MSPTLPPVRPARPIVAIAALSSCPVAAAVDIADAWVRATVARQTASASIDVRDAAPMMKSR